MNQEDKELLLKDLCARLPYNVKVQFNYIITSPAILKGINKDFIECDIAVCELEDVKPCLYPLSSMTEEQKKEVHSLIYQGISESVDETKEWLKTRKENELRPITLTYILCHVLVIDWFCKNHFDYRGLIPKGLAIDATGLNIY